jgi:hypothetical protein
VKVPIGRENPLRQAAQLADAQPLFRPEPPLPKFAKFLSITAHLQRIMGDSDFFFSTRDMAKAVVVESPRTISAYTSIAVREGFLFITKRYPRGSKRANRYRFNLEKLPNLKDMDN